METPGRSQPRRRAIGSAGERLVHTEEVTGSIPVSPTRSTEVRGKLTELHDELNDGVVTNAGYTVAHAIRDWLADGLAGRAPKTVST